MAKDHLSPDQLASLATADAEDPPHVATCEACRSDLDAMRHLVADLRTLPDPPGRLLDAAKTYFRRRRRLEALIERLVEDPALRAKAASRPEAVLTEAGLEPLPELIEAIRDPGRHPTDLARRLAAKGLWF
jgi:hypothetical protein